MSISQMINKKISDADRFIQSVSFLFGMALGFISRYFLIQTPLDNLGGVSGPGLARGVRFFEATYLGGFLGIVLFVPVALRQLYKNLSSYYYSGNNPVTQGPTDPEEKIAFNSGVESREWMGYAKSFLQWQAYRHPIAYGAGLRHGKEIQHCDEKDLPQLREMKNR